MITGYNANIRHGGRVFHVQTEDSGRANPHVITHLYYEGTILASERRDYAEILDAPDLVAQVRQLMEEQHTRVVEGLRRGAFDRVIAARLSRPPQRASAAPSEMETPPATAVPAELRRAPAADPTAERPADAPRAFGEGIVSERPLDAVILDYLIAKSRERTRGKRGSRSGG